jgi:hypothetical protein
LVFLLHSIYVAFKMDIMAISKNLYTFFLLSSLKFVPS